MWRILGRPLRSRNHWFLREIMHTLNSSSAQQTVNGARNHTRHCWLTAAGTATVIAAASHLGTLMWRHRRPLHDRRDWNGRQRLRARIAAEFVEMPGMILTVAQAGRLLGMPVPICARLLRTLVAEGLIRCREDGRYVRT